MYCCIFAIHLMEEKLRETVCLFRGFEKDATPGRFTIKTAKANIEGEVLYTAIIVENSHPEY